MSQALLNALAQGQLVTTIAPVVTEIGCTGPFLVIAFMTSVVPEMTMFRGSRCWKLYIIVVPASHIDTSLDLEANLCRRVSLKL